MLALNGIAAKQSINGQSRSAQIKYMIYGVMMCIVSTVVLCVIGGMIFSFVDVSSQAISVSVFAIGYISAAIGGFFAGRNIGVNGFVNGLLTGIIYFLILLGLSMLFSKTSLSVSAILARGIPTILLSAFGGAIGVNVR